MDKLLNIREEIDSIDKEIAILFSKRMNAVKKVAEYKKSNNLPIFDSSRENDIINKNIKLLSDTELIPFYKDFLSSLMNISKEYQKKLIENGGELK